MANNQNYQLQIQGVSQATQQVQNLSNTLQQLQNQLANTQQGTQAFQNLTNQIQQTQAQLTQANQQMNQLNGQRMSGLRSTLGSLGTGFASVASQTTGAQNGVDLLTQATATLGVQSELLNAIIARFGTVSTASFAQATTASQKFSAGAKIALASTGIGLLLVAIASLTAYFGKTTEGSKKMAVAMAYLQGIFNGLVSVLAKVGKSIVDIVTNFDSVAKSMKGTADDVVNYFKDVAESPKILLDDIISFFQGKFKILGEIWDAVKGGNFKDAANGVLQFYTGIENGIDKATAAVKEFGDTVSKSVDQSLKINQLEQSLKRVTLAAAKQTAALENIIAKNEQIAASDIKSEKERVAATNAVLVAKRKLLDVQNSVLGAQLKLTQAENAQVPLGQKSISMLQAEQDLINEMSKNNAEKDRLSLERAEQLYAISKENADRIKDSLEREYEQQKYILEVELQSAQTQQEKIDIYNKILAAQIDYNIKAKDAYSTLADTSDRAAALLSLTTELNDAQREYTANVKATNDEYKKRLTDASEGQVQANIEAVKLKAQEAGNANRLVEQKNYLQEAEALEMIQLMKWYEQEKNVKGKLPEELALLEQTFANKKLTIQQNYSTQHKGISDKITADEIANQEKQREAFEKKIDAMLSIYDSLAGAISTFNQLQVDASTAALDAQISEIDALMNSSKETLSTLQQEISDSESRVDQLESDLLSAKGAEREKIIQQLEQERKKQKQIAQEKKAEDERIKKAEADKLKLESQKEKTLAKQQVLTQSLTLAQNALNAAKAVEAALEASSKGKFGWDNIAILAAATVAIVTTIKTLKNATSAASNAGNTNTGSNNSVPRGFREGGYTSESISDSTPAGIVHSNEYVVPAWMVRQNPILIDQLENVRTSNQYASGGMVAANVNAPSPTDLAMLNQIQLLNSNLHAYSQTPIYTVATEIVETNARVTNIKEYSIK